MKGYSQVEKDRAQAGVERISISRLVQRRILSDIRVVVEQGLRLNPPTQGKGDVEDHAGDSADGTSKQELL